VNISQSKGLIVIVVKVVYFLNHVIL